MLNKKGISMPSDNIELIVVAISMVFVFMIVSFLSAAHIGLISTATDNFVIENKVFAIDAQFMDSDLLNILRMEIADNYTLGEIFTLMPRNFPDDKDSFLFNGLVEREISDRMTCDEELYNKLNNILEPTYGEDWMISVFSEDERLFTCTPIIIDFANPGEAEITLYSSEGKKVTVLMEVYE